MSTVAKMVRWPQQTLWIGLQWTPKFANEAIKGVISESKHLHTSAISKRWHKNLIANRNIPRHGYNDIVKQSGALPRISEDSRRIAQLKVFRPSNPFAPKEALFGQNDYIDILGT